MSGTPEGASPWDRLSREYMADTYPEAVDVVERLVAELEEWREIAPPELRTPGLFRMYVDALEEANRDDPRFLHSGLDPVRVHLRLLWSQVHREALLPDVAVGEDRFRPDLCPDSAVDGEAMTPASVPAPDPAAKAIENLLAAMQTQNDTIRQLTDSVRILNDRVGRLERDQPERNIG